MRSLGIHLRALSSDDVKIPGNKTRLEIAVLKWHLGLPVANELTVICSYEVFALFYHYHVSRSQFPLNTTVLLDQVLAESLTCSRACSTIMMPSQVCHFLIHGHTCNTDGGNTCVHFWDGQIPILANELNYCRKLFLCRPSQYNNMIQPV